MAHGFANAVGFIGAVDAVAIAHGEADPSRADGIEGVAVGVGDVGFAVGVAGVDGSRVGDSGFADGRVHAFSSESNAVDATEKGSKIEFHFEALFENFDVARKFGHEQFHFGIDQVGAFEIVDEGDGLFGTLVSSGDDAQAVASFHGHAAGDHALVGSFFKKLRALAIDHGDDLIPRLTFGVFEVLEHLLLSLQNVFLAQGCFVVEFLHVETRRFFDRDGRVPCFGRSRRLLWSCLGKEVLESEHQTDAKA